MFYVLNIYFNKNKLNFLVLILAYDTLNHAIPFFIYLFKYYITKS